MQAQTFWKLRPFVAILLMSLGFLAPMRAEAQVVVQVGTLSYAIEVSTGTFDTVGSDVMNSPWWSNLNDAQTFATLYADSGADFGTGTTYFAYENFTLGGGLEAVQAIRVLTNGNYLSQPQPLRTDGSFKFATATVVPEIDGPVLARMALVLCALYLGIKIIRQRRFGAVTAT